MAVVKSDLVTTEDTVGSQVEDHIEGAIKGKTSTYAASGAISDNDVILMCKVPVDANLTSVILNSDDLGTTGALNCGLYPANGTTISADTDAVDEDCIATAVDVNTAAVSNSELRFEVQDINTINSKAWELAGLSARPDYDEFYVALTASAATTAAGDISLKVEFI